MTRVIKVNHVAVAVDDLEASLRFWRDGLGMHVQRTEEVPEQQAVVSFLPTDEAQIELVQPTDPESGTARFLAKRGPGVHHICLEVDQLEPILTRLREQGVRLINDQPVVGAEGHRIAFVHPESTQGVLVELVETSPLAPLSANESR